jgi:hypothetical protein
LPQIWSGQEMLGLLLAGLFAASVNLCMIARWIWSEIFAQGWADFFGTLALLTWLVSLVYSVWWVGLYHPDRHRQAIETLFREAQEAYLQGRWADSRRRIEQILARDETDADALMQLGAIYLRTDQPALARRTFLQCLELKGGAKWRWEIEQALSRTNRALR